MTKKRKCWECGKTVEVSIEEYYNPCKLTTYDKMWNARKNINKMEFCTECKKKRNEDKKIKNLQYSKLKAEFMIDRAVAIMEKQNIDVYEYKEVIELVSLRAQEDTNKFRSAEEMVAAIILTQHRIPIKMNYKIGSYSADVFISGFSCVVEVDGFLHERENVKLKDGTKDLYIRQLLGKEWEVVRIPTIYIHENAENLVSAIIELKSKMVEIREKNGGFLPYGFSKTLNAVYKKTLKGDASAK